MRLIVPTLLLCTACARPNPAFNLGEDTDGALTQTDPSSGGDGDGGDGDGGDGDGGDGDGGDGDGDTADTSGLGCAALDHPALDLIFGKIPGDQIPCEDPRSGFFRVVTPIANGWQLEPCLGGQACGGCGDNLDFDFTMFPLEPAGPAPACIWAHVETYIDDGDSQICRYAGLTIWDALDGSSFPILVVSGALESPSAIVEDLGDLQPVLVSDESCTCEEQPSPCCEPANPPASYGLTLGGEVAYQGEPVPYELPAVTYDFYNIRAQFSGACGDDFDVEWALIRGG